MWYMERNLCGTCKIRCKIRCKYGVKYGVISGETKDRSQVVKDFNDGIIKVLVITQAGSTGIDLKGVQNVIVLDPVWNPATLDQIIGRAVRNKSHTHLPKEKQKVKIHILLYVEKNFIDGKIIHTARTNRATHLALCKPG